MQSGTISHHSVPELGAASCLWHSLARSAGSSADRVPQLTEVCLLPNTIVSSFLYLEILPIIHMFVPKHSFFSPQKLKVFSSQNCCSECSKSLISLLKCKAE